MITPSFWSGKRVFVTGHTGFKGSWLSLWLHRLGAHVTGYALPPPTQPALFELARIPELITSIQGDVTDAAAVEAALIAARPEIVIHLAAQTLVRYSYEAPIETIRTNVLGTAHVLDAIRRVPSVRAVVVITSDKCYYNEEWPWGYREEDRLGGDDPYSASKAAAEMVVATYQHSYFAKKHGAAAPALASTRAGNVIGGGDWTRDALIPDILRSLLKGEPTVIRSPKATRPWQHVLEPLHGYLTLAEHLYERGHEFATSWNFGPPETSERSVAWIIDTIYRLWGTDMKWIRDTVPGPPENMLLKLDSSKARHYLGWRPKLDLPTSLAWIVDWTRRYQSGADVRATTLADIDRFMTLAPPA